VRTDFSEDLAAWKMTASTAKLRFLFIKVHSARLESSNHTCQKNYAQTIHFEL